MSLTSTVSCVSDDFYFYYVLVFGFAIFVIIIQIIFVLASIFYAITVIQKNYIILMMSLTMMGLTPGPLVCALSLFALKIPLVVFVPIGVKSKGG